MELLIILKYKSNHKTYIIYHFVYNVQMALRALLLMAMADYG